MLDRETRQGDGMSIEGSKGAQRQLNGTHLVLIRSPKRLGFISASQAAAPSRFLHLQVPNELETAAVPVRGAEG